MTELFGMTALELLIRSWPYAAIGGIAGILVILSYSAGKLRERAIWRQELEDGNRMGAVMKEKIDKRDAKIKSLIVENNRIKGWIVRLIQQRRVALKLSKELSLIMAANSITEDIASRRKEA